MTLDPSFTRVVPGAVEVDVLVVGVGTVRFVRRELTPRKVGQAQFAQRREVAWSALRGCVVLETVVGSRAWGLSDEGSDTDLRGIFALPLPWSAWLIEGPADLVSADGSEQVSFGEELAETASRRRRDDDFRLRLGPLAHQEDDGRRRQESGDGRRP